METAQKNEWTRLSKEQREKLTPEFVENLMEQFVTPEQWELFRQQNKAEFSKIAHGYVSKVMTFYSKQKNQPYKARVKGLLVNNSSGEERITVSMNFAQRELIIPTTMTIKNGQDVLNLSEKQIEKLTNDGLLDDVAVSEKGAQFFVEIDRGLNRVAIADAQYIHMPKTLHGVELTTEQSEAIKAGKVMEYERENPNNKNEMFLFKARYSPIFYTIRSEQVLDEMGRAVVHKIEPSKIATSQVLQAAEEILKETGRKNKKQVVQKQQK